MIEIIILNKELQTPRHFGRVVKATDLNSRMKFTFQNSCLTSVFFGSAGSNPAGVDNFFLDGPPIILTYYLLTYYS